MAKTAQRRAHTARRKAAVMRRMKATMKMGHDEIVTDSWASEWLRRSTVDRKVGKDSYDLKGFQRERDALFGAYDLDLRNY
jgi:hypothetical protein